MGSTLDTIFLSSTAQDMKEFRAAVWERLNAEAEFKCFGHEYTGPHSGAPVDECRAKLQQCSIYVGIFSDRRGFEPFNADENDEHADKRSITEMEYDWAKEFGLSIFVWMTPVHFPHTTERESDKVFERQRLFRERVQSERWFSEKGFLSGRTPELRTPEQLAVEIENKLLRFRQATLIADAAPPQTGSAERPTRRETVDQLDAALDTLSDMGDIDLIAMARSGQTADLADIEAKLQSRAENLEAEAKSRRAEAARLWRQIGWVAFLNDTQKALGAYKRSVKLDPDDAEGRQYLGELQFRLGRIDHAEKNFLRMERISRSRGDKSREGLACLRQSWISDLRGDQKRRRELTETALRLGNETANLDLQARALSNLGAIHRAQGNLDDAQAAQLESFALYRQLGDETGMAAALSNLGLVYLRQDDFKMAEEAQLEAFALYHRHGNQAGMATAKGNLGILYRRTGEPAKAESAQLEALAIDEQLRNKEGIAIATFNLGSIVKDRGDTTKAREYFCRSRDAYRELGNETDAAEAEQWLEQLGRPPV